MASHSFGEASTTNALKQSKQSPARSSRFGPSTEKTQSQFGSYATPVHQDAGVCFSQGDDWQTMHPAGFMSKKFTDAQRSYYTYEHEMLGVIEALKKWDDILLGLPEIRIITDHEALKTFMQKSHAGPRQIRWSQWLTRYRLKFIHVAGTLNRSADTLSRIYENPNSKPRLDDMSTADLLLDLEGDDLPESRLLEKKIHHLTAMTRAQQVRDV